MWSLDATHAMLCPSTRFWSSTGKGIAQVSFESVTLPDTLIQRMVDTPLADHVEHPCLTDPGIMIDRVSVYAPSRNPVTGRMSAGTTQFNIRVPIVTYPDPAI